ncbi:MAG: dapL [Proteobacteria bacterium]|nr:dapL [Pseudomonadota bacterium]
MSSCVPLPLSPFQRLGRLITGVEPGLPPIDVSVGEPRHPVPSFVGPVLSAALADFVRYPPIKGTPAFRAAVAGWAERRFGLPAGTIDRDDGVLPLNGSREGLFHATLTAVRLAGATKGSRPAILLPNPFYAVYAAAAEAAGAEPVLVAASRKDGFLPRFERLPADLLARTVAAFHASPANPQGAVADLERLQGLVSLARQYGFLLFSDECYSEIWRGRAPDGVLSAALSGGGFQGVVAFNSLSKRSNLAGARCGFAIGDPAFLKAWAGLRNVTAPQVPMPIQAVAVAALADEAHVLENRRLYDLKYAVAQEILGDRFPDLVPPGGFFLWLDVGRWGGGEDVTARLWKEKGVKVVPGGYLSATDADGINPGGDFIRIAMVESLETSREALSRLSEVLS